MTIVKKLWNACRAVIRKVKHKIDEALPSPKLQLLVFGISTALNLLLAYLIALIQVGTWNDTTSILGLLELYIFDGYDFPFLFYFVAALFITIAVFWVAASGSGEEDRNFKYSDSDVYGSAGEISKEDLQKVGELKPIEELAGTILGQLDTTGTQVIGMTPNPVANKNIMVFASPGQGKSFSIVKPQIVQAIRRGESVVCTDTKGEIRADTIELARRYGYTIRNVNFKYLQYSDGWDILKELRCDDERAEIFSHIVMKNSDNPKDPHIALEEAVLTACCLYVERNPLIPANEKTFYKVYSLIVQGPAKLDEIFQAAQFDSNLRIAYDTYSPFRTGSGNLRDNVIGNLASRIKALNSPVVQALTSKDEVDLTLPGRKKCIYYVTMSDQHDTMKFLASLFFTFLFLDLGDFADAQLSQRLPVPVNVILEEAANVGEIVGLKNILASARSRAIAITLIFQGKAQLLETYGINNTETIQNCCFVHACLGTMERGTAEHFEWLSGVATVKVKTEQHDAFESPLTANYRHSTGDGRRNVFTSDEVRKIQQGYILLGWLGYDTIKCHTFGINQHPEFKKGNMPKIHPMPAVPLSNADARAFLREKEEQRVAEYEAWENDGGYPWEGYVYPPPKCNGPSRHKEKPCVIPYPELEQMALAFAEGKLEAAKTEATVEQILRNNAPAENDHAQSDKKSETATTVVAQEQTVDSANIEVDSQRNPDDTEQETSNVKCEDVEDALPQPSCESPFTTQASEEKKPEAMQAPPHIIESGTPNVKSVRIPEHNGPRDKKVPQSASKSKLSGSGTLYATRKVSQEKKQK